MDVPIQVGLPDKTLQPTVNTSKYVPTNSAMYRAAALSSPTAVPTPFPTLAPSPFPTAWPTPAPTSPLSTPSPTLMDAEFCDTNCGCVAFDGAARRLANEEGVQLLAGPSVS